MQSIKLPASKQREGAAKRRSFVWFAAPSLCFLMMRLPLEAGRLSDYSITWIQPSGASILPIWIPVSVS